MKQCSKCNCNKSLDAFYFKDAKTGRKDTVCKDCRNYIQVLKYNARSDVIAFRSNKPAKRTVEDIANYKREWASKNKERLQIQRKEYYRKNREHLLRRVAAWVENNTKRVRQTKQKWKDLNPDCLYAARIRRGRALKDARPKWVDNEWEQFAMQEMYSLRRLRSVVTGVEWHVDHEVPLLSKNVCGLHCVSNLRVIPAIENLRKNNLTWEHQW